MSLPRLRMVLLIFSSVISGYFTFTLGEQIREFFCLELESSVRVTRWEVEEHGERYRVKAHYQGDPGIQSSFVFKENFFNLPSAVADLQLKAQEDWTAWYNPRLPQASALEKEFPLNLLLRTLVCYGVLLYFWGWKRHLLASL